MIKTRIGTAYVTSNFVYIVILLLYVFQSKGLHAGPFYFRCDAALFAIQSIHSGNQKLAFFSINRHNSPSVNVVNISLFDYNSNREKAVVGFIKVLLC